MSPALAIRTVLLALALAACAAPPGPPAGAVPAPGAPAPSPAASPHPAPPPASAPAGPPAAAPDASPSPTPAAPPRMRGLDPDAPCPAEFSGTCYPVWFGTNRKPLDPRDPSKGFGTEFDDRLHYGKRIVRIPASHRPGELGSPLWRRLLTGTDDRLRVEPPRVVPESAFVAEVRAFLARLDPSDRNVLVFIHGYNTTFDDAARRAAQIGFDLKVPGITAFFSWPSQGSTRAYLTDQSAMEASEGLLADFLVRMSSLADPGRVHLIAHSMGNRGLLRAMHRATTQAALRSGTRFGQIFLAAPDVDIHLFRQLATIYPQVSERTTLYVADEDKAFGALAWITAGVRVGGAPPVVVMPGIDTVRVRGTGLFRIGHSYVAEELDVLRDIRALLYWREPPERRRARHGWPVPDETPGAWVLGR